MFNELPPKLLRPPPPTPPTKPPKTELSSEQQAWVTMYCAAISAGKQKHDAREIADYGVISLRDLKERFNGK